MTDEELNTLIAELEAAYQALGWKDDPDLSQSAIRGQYAAKALTDLRTERDAALAVIDKAREHVNNWRDNDAQVILATVPTTALADRDAFMLREFVREGVCLSCGGAVLNSGEHVEEDRHADHEARILEEAAQIALNSYGPNSAHTELLSRAASRRREASPVTPKNGDN